MSNINLLPKKVKGDIQFAKKNAKLISVLTFSIFSGAVLLLGALGAILLAQAQLANTKKQVTAKEEEKKKFEVVSINNQSVKVEEESTRLERKIKAIQTIKKDQLFWSKMIEEISVITPDSVYLNGLPLSSGVENKITLAGFAVEQLDVARYRNALEESSFFRYVDIQSISNSSGDTGGSEGFSFSINAQLEDVKTLREAQ